jgi:hypothetical protein
MGIGKSRVRIRQAIWISRVIPRRKCSMRVSVRSGCTPKGSQPLIHFERFVHFRRLFT